MASSCRAGLALFLALAASSCAARPARSERVPSADGVPIAYETHGPRVPSEGRPALVFVHCWAGHRGYWRGQLDVFAERHRVVALDLAGHGESGHERSEWSIPGLAADVVAVADALGLERMVLIGHSLGGPVSLAAARELSGRVVAVVPVDTVQDADFELPAGFVEALARRFEEDFAGTMEEFVGALFAPGADPAVARWTLAQAIEVPDRRAAVALLRGFETLDLPRLLSQAGVPVHAINSTRGIPTSLEHNRAYADFDVTPIEGVGHFPQLERPQEFNVVLERVLAELEARPAP
jgi:pimeloyl-ACP methyl ester carboxylesterase